MCVGVVVEVIAGNGRLGNNLHQFLHGLAFAEATNAQTVFISPLGQLPSILIKPPHDGKFEVKLSPANEGENSSDTKAPDCCGIARCWRVLAKWLPWDIDEDLPPGCHLAHLAAAKCGASRLHRCT